VEAISALGIEPYIVDVDNYLVTDKLSSGEIDLVVNLNSGATPISNVALVPSIAEWHRIPCFPNSADVLLVGERKDVCKQFFSEWFHTPRDLTRLEISEGSVPLIAKPKTMGNSRGVTRTLPKSETGQLTAPQPTLPPDMIIEEFIEGYELTIPVIFDALEKDYIVLPGILYLPEVEQPTRWFLSYEDKIKRKIQVERRVLTLTAGVVDALKEASRAFQFQCLARFDFRWRTESPTLQSPTVDDLFFLEINCHPTLKTNVNFILSVKDHLMSRSGAIAVAANCTQNPDINALAFLLLQRHLSLTTK
jgi:hypothetical protein